MYILLLIKVQLLHIFPNILHTMDEFPKEFVSPVLC